VPGEKAPKCPTATQTIKSTEMVQPTHVLYETHSANAPMTRVETTKGARPTASVKSTKKTRPTGDLHAQDFAEASQTATVQETMVAEEEFTGKRVRRFKRS